MSLAHREVKENEAWKNERIPELNRESGGYVGPAAGTSLFLSEKKESEGRDD